jgi:GAF domain-containing protein
MTPGVTRLANRCSSVEWWALNSSGVAVTAHRFAWQDPLLGRALSHSPLWQTYSPKTKGSHNLADYDLLMQALRSFASDMGRSYDIIEMFYKLGERVTEALGVAGAGVSVGDASGELKFVTATSERMVLMEQVQQRYQEGPCVSAFRTQQPVVINQIDAVSDWRDYGEVARQLQLTAVVGYPLIHEELRLGALNVYAESRQWSNDDLDVLGVFADMATAYLVRTAELAETRELAKQLQGALDSRVLIEQAKGVLANEHGIEVEDAFRRIRRHSQNHNVKLLEVCRQVVNHGLKIPDTD